MLLDDLVGVIETLKARIATHGTVLRENETRTRMALIDPLLTALGWDTSDPELVTPEYPISHGRADYALLTKPDAKPVAVLEAKKLDEPLDGHRMRMVTYALESGVAYAGLINGDQWHIYNVFKPVPLADKRVLDVSIANTPAREAVLKLLLLWRPNLASGQPVAANEPVLVPQAEPAPAQPSQQSSAPAPQVQERAVEPVPPAPSMDDSGWMDIANVKYHSGSTRPFAIRFSGSTPKDLRNWVDVWYEVCKWLSDTGRFSSADCPVPSPRGKGVRYLANTEARHPVSTRNHEGKDFTQSRQISTGLFIETNYSPKDLLHNSIFLLEKRGVDPATVEMRFG